MICEGSYLAFPRVLLASLPPTMLVDSLRPCCFRTRLFELDDVGNRGYRYAWILEKGEATVTIVIRCGAAPVNRWIMER